MNHHTRINVDEPFAYYQKNSIDKSCNKSMKIGASCQVVDLNLDQHVPPQRT